MSTSDLDPGQLALLSEMTGEELIKRGEKLLEIGRRLLMQAGAVGALTDLPEERSVGRFGVVTETIAVGKAIELQSFTQREFGEALGLRSSGVNRWLAKLINRRHPIVELRDGRYHYIEPPASGNARRAHKPTPEAQAIDRSVTPERGEAVRVPAVKRHHRDLSKSGRGHQLKQKDRETERAAAARREREARKRRNGTSNGNGSG